MLDIYIFWEYYSYKVMRMTPAYLKVEGSTQGFVQGALFMATGFLCWRLTKIEGGNVYWPSVALYSYLGTASFIDGISLLDSSSSIDVCNRIGPRPTPRLDYDVNTGLPNHRAMATTPQHTATLHKWVDPSFSEIGIGMSDQLAMDNINNLVVGGGVTWKV
jgi:hypothetical protein